MRAMNNILNLKLNQLNLFLFTFLKTCTTYWAINVSIPWKFHYSVTCCKQPMRSKQASLQPMRSEQSDSLPVLFDVTVRAGSQICCLWTLSDLGWKIQTWRNESGEIFSRPTSPLQLMRHRLGIKRLRQQIYNSQLTSTHSRGKEGQPWARRK